MVRFIKRTSPEEIKKGFIILLFMTAVGGAQIFQVSGGVEEALFRSKELGG